MIVPVYGAVLALLFLVLSVRTLLLRRRFLIGVGHGKNPLLLRAARVHANFAEYVPLALLLLYWLEQSAWSATCLHASGVALVVGRLLHAYGVSQENEPLQFRVLGMVLTLTVVGVAALVLLWKATSMS